MAHLHSEVERVQEVMSQNVDRLVERERNLDVLQEKTEELGLNVSGDNKLSFLWASRW